MTDNKSQPDWNVLGPELLGVLIVARNELACLPRSLGYDFTHLPKIDAAIAKADGLRYEQ